MSQIHNFSASFGNITKKKKESILDCIFFFSPFLFKHFLLSSSVILWMEISQLCWNDGLSSKFNQSVCWTINLSLLRHTVLVWRRSTVNLLMDVSFQKYNMWSCCQWELQGDPCEKGLGLPCGGHSCFQLNPPLDEAHCTIPVFLHVHGNELCINSPCVNVPHNKPVIHIIQRLVSTGQSAEIRWSLDIERILRRS